jgi:hypothetical protein
LYFYTNFTVMEIAKDKKAKIGISEKNYPKKLDAAKFLGAIKWIEDPVKYQRKLRDGK